MSEGNTVLARIEGVARRVFVNDAIVLARTMTAEDVPGWDSLTHLVFVLELERCFGVRIPAEQVLELDTVGALADWIGDALRAATAPRP